MIPNCKSKIEEIDINYEYLYRNTNVSTKQESVNLFFGDDTHTGADMYNVFLKVYNKKAKFVCKNNNCNFDISFNTLKTITSSGQLSNIYLSWINSTTFNYLLLPALGPTGLVGNLSVNRNPIIRHESLQDLNSKQEECESNMQILSGNLANWGCSSYDYGTPTPEELTTYLTENNNLILNKITKWVEKGTILKVSYIQSTADRASRYSRYFTVSYNYGYGDMYGDKYKFKDLDGSSEFYISIPAGSQTQYMWNTWINADNPIGCLTENIQVLVDTNTETGDVFTKVKNLKVGDTVLSYNIENDKIEPKKITDIIIKEGNIINTISTQTQTFSVTNNHQIYTNDLKLVNAGTIKSQDLLTNINREDVKVGNNIAKYIEDGETVYEIIVEDNNNLFITKEKILIHNGS